MNENKNFFVVGFLLILLIVSIGFMGGSTDEQPLVDVSESTDETQASAVTVTPEDSEEGLRQFSSEDFKVAFDNLTHPNMLPIVDPPEITGSATADAYIRELAEQRGYDLRQIASGLLNSVEGVPVQELLIEDWDALAEQAITDGIEINLVSGYRSIEEQLEIFNSVLLPMELTSEQITSGVADAQLDQLLSITAPPGYSRHHSGYTIDVEDPNYAVFAGSTAHAWLSEDNYRVAKQYGFIPSYPEDLENQGPNPEAWEYVWVGTQVTHN